MTNRTRVAVIGVGYLGKIHAKIYAGMENVELVAVLDTDPKAAKRVASEYGCQGLTRTVDLAGKVDAVSIVVPTSLHLEVSRKFLGNGVHTMLEKPVAPSVQESREIVSLARENGAILQIGHLERFNAGVMKLAELSTNPRFIEVHRLGKFVERATDVDVVTDLMIHDIDIVLSLIKSLTGKRYLLSGNKVITDHVDIANARLEFENGSCGQCHSEQGFHEPVQANPGFRRAQLPGAEFCRPAARRGTTRQNCPWRTLPRAHTPGYRGSSPVATECRACRFY